MRLKDGSRAWQVLRLLPAYQAAWRRRRGRQQPCLMERAPFPIRLQTAADLAAARFGLLAWLDPLAVTGPASPFWRVAPMLPASVEAGATPLIGAGLSPGITVEGLRLLDGRLVVKLELGAGAVQLRLAAGRGFDPGDGVVLQHDLREGPKPFIRRLEEACALAAGNVPCGGGGRATGSC
jgi:hypothetical protein